MGFGASLIQFATPTQMNTGQGTVGTSAVQLSDESVFSYNKSLSTFGKAIKSVTIKADDDNAGNVYVIVTSGGTTSTGFRLIAGQGVDISVDSLDDVWLIADSANQKVHVLMVK